MTAPARTNKDREIILDRSKERGIPMAGQFIPKLLDGTKTMTRRPMKPQPLDIPEGWYADRYNNTERWTFWGPRKTPESGKCWLPFFKCPYGQPGDRLWVRETVYYDASTRFPKTKPKDFDSRFLIYRADGTCCEQFVECDHESGPARWTPSIHMPRWASRILLEIESVRVERVQDIPAGDLEKEGYFWSSMDDNFRGSWEKRYPGSWDRNDFCWVISFRRIAP